MPTKTLKTIVIDELLNRTYLYIELVIQLDNFMIKMFQPILVIQDILVTPSVRNWNQF